MRYAVLSVAALLVAGLSPAGAQQPIEVHPNKPAGGGLEISIPPINNPNYLDYGPLPDKPGADKSQDYMEQAGGNYENLSGPGSDVDADVMPDSDGAYESPLD
ncbi:hypothetical protein [Ancylobacter rudongensis]|uniref:Uncharacterized protein n=1 Tax=Ancylobacter rudongensis TaxID=177413 RepID=A0A1G4QNM7_9HYPH|nr:hypothetical protein [Ancylobacter rudongensis]SCW46142.1 hypothetical protein SAMN05660859_1328 [Ancylobacter rudongensis]